MKKILLMLSVFSGLALQAQVLIDDTNTATVPNENAILELNSNDKGLLLPRIEGISTALEVEGMLYYDVLGKCFRAYDGTDWQTLGDECLPETTYEIVIADATPSPADEGTDQTFVVTVSPAIVAGTTVTVDYTTADGTAVATEDYTAASGTLTFTEGQSSQNIVVSTLTDGTEDAAAIENYTVNLSNPNTTGYASATITTESGTGEINDLDATTSGYVQNFDAGSNWNYTLSTPLCNDNGDVWDIVSSPWNAISMEDNFFGVQDLDGNCGSAAGETITFDTVNITNETTISFDYNIFEWDQGDDVLYTVYFDGIAQAEVQLIDGNNNLSVTGTQVINIPTGTSNVSLELLIDQNGGGDYGGFDNFIIQ